MVVPIDNSFHLDTILKKVGGFKKYQVIRLALVGFVLLSRSISGYNYLFYSQVPNYRCLIDECEDSNSTEYNTVWIKDAVPFKNDRPSNCERYAFSENISDISNCSASSFNQHKIIHCRKFVFESEFRSIADDFDIYCDDKLWMLTLPGTIYFLGLFTALPISGYLADRYGRKTILVAFTIAGSISCELQTLLSYNYWILLCFEFLNGVAQSGAFPAAFTLILEMVGPSYRSLGACYAFSVGVFGEILLAVIAMHIYDWRWMIRLASLPPLLIIFYIWALPESVRWLVAKNKIERANKALKSMARCNGVELSKFDYFEHRKSNAKMKNDLDKNTVQPLTEEKFLQMFQSKVLTIRFVCCTFCWFVCAFLFYGITLGSVNIFGNMYLNFMMIELSELPGNVIGLLLTEKIGRKWTLFLSYLMTAVSCLAFTVLQGESLLKLIVYLLGKCFITSAFLCIYIYTTEMFPTLFRQRVMGLCSSLARIGSMSAPQMPFLAHVWVSLPQIVFAIVAVLAAAISLIFPETRNTDLPGTIQEAENITNNGKESF